MRIVTKIYEPDRRTYNYYAGRDIRVYFFSIAEISATDDVYVLSETRCVRFGGGGTSGFSIAMALDASLNTAGRGKSHADNSRWRPTL